VPFVCPLVAAFALVRAVIVRSNRYDHVFRFPRMLDQFMGTRCETHVSPSTQGLPIIRSG
jgi:hypothetical protein